MPSILVSLTGHRCCHHTMSDSGELPSCLLLGKQVVRARSERENLTQCQDRFTTNFFLPDGSYGNIVSGNYTSAQGGIANLITGNYTLSAGQAGNIYSSVPSAKPNTATLAIPTPWTSSGIGTAISASRVGQLATYTTTIPGTVIAPSAVTAQTITPSYGNITIISATTIPGTSLPPVTTTVTTAGSGLTPTSSNMGRTSSGDLQAEMISITILLSFLVLLI